MLQVEDSFPPMKKPKRSSYKQTTSRLTLDDNTNYVVIATICFVITFINYYILTFCVGKSTIILLVSK